MLITDRLILDTGSLIALLHRDDQNHKTCPDFLSSFRGLLLTTETVLTQAIYLFGRHFGGVSACLDFFIRRAAHLVPLTHRGLIRCNSLIAKYADVPMDFADGTVVALAEETKVKTIFALDHRGFEVYRCLKDSPFKIMP